ncbi:uncharacterized protein BDZ83DRAFT_370828 [Colletotrichum acutatum]|uniref:Uncharacterized protein n=1 Tax=Glomerella acutata TaxID=27357 RepID=A0AAD8UM34_GLOAC|nr:uncharacterized protein BDZ83DRAFT_370828 [Colletotrichum acutatum]KAK1723851.1 hypothetical protein BDZ83DRAFT_370828 [Colletotrichum acutatum]
MANLIDLTEVTAYAEDNCMPGTTARAQLGSVMTWDLTQSSRGPTDTVMSDHVSLRVRPHSFTKDQHHRSAIPQTASEFTNKLRGLIDNFFFYLHFYSLRLKESIRKSGSSLENHRGPREGAFFDDHELCTTEMARFFFNPAQS